MGEHRPSRRGAVRASDDEREVAVRALRRHFTSGRLDAEELEERVDRAYAARTRGELAAVFTDLPRGGRRAGVDTRRLHRAALAMHGFTYATVNGALVGIWALTGAGEFWPAWSLLPWGTLLGWHAIGPYALSRALRSGSRRRVGSGRGRDRALTP